MFEQRELHFHLVLAGLYQWCSWACPLGTDNRFQSPVDRPSPQPFKTFTVKPQEAGRGGLQNFPPTPVDGAELDLRGQKH